MSEERMISAEPHGWRGWAAAAFAALWGAVGALFIPGPERGIMEEASAFAGKLFGTGMAYGVVAALVAHILLLRGASRNAKLLTYAAGALVGGLVSVIANQ
jgi:hypothetical protein